MYNTIRLQSRKVRFAMIALALLVALTLGVMLSHTASAAELPAAYTAQVEGVNDANMPASGVIDASLETIAIPADQSSISFTVSDGSEVSNGTDSSNSFVADPTPDAAQ